jgi:hypothetical protein
MAHLERGYMLALSTAPATENETAQNAFKAAEVAFEEALRPLAAGPDGAIPEAQWPKQLGSVGPNATITDLSAENQAALLATFHHAVAKYWQARVMPSSEAKSVAASAAQEFSALRDNIGLHTEWLTVRYAEGLSQTFAGENEKAAAAFDDVLSVQLGGCSDVARGTADGIKQAALLALVHEHLRNGDQKKALQAAEDFWILYPLDASSSAGAEIERDIKPALENKN